MRIVVNTNRIIAALIKDSASRKVLLSDKLEFVTVGITKLEIGKYKNEIMEKAKINEEDFIKLLSILFSRIFVINDVVIQDKMGEAKIIMDEIDPADTPFIALALSVENDGIWSEDRHFELQNKIKIWKTKDLLTIV